jgi:hypothetical protein
LIPVAVIESTLFNTWHIFEVGRGGERGKILETNTETRLRLQDLRE